MDAGERLSEKQNRALLARDTNPCDLSQKSHTHFFFFFFSGLSTPAEGARCGVPLLQVWELPLGSKVLRWEAQRN